MKTEKEALIKSILKCLLLERKCGSERDGSECEQRQATEQNRTYTLIAKMLVLCFFLFLLNK